MGRIEFYIDGASKGNPGPSGIGIVVCKEGVTVKNISTYIGIATNNTAEYTALIYALQEALLIKADSVAVKTDSELLQRQVTKKYKIKNANLIGLYNQAAHIIAGFKDFSIQHIPRENNRGADKLANLAIKKALKKK